MDSLKAHKPTGTLSLYDILHVKGARYTNNEDLCTALEFLDYTSMYPLYGYLVRDKLEEDKLRSKFLPIARQKFRDILRFSGSLKSNAARDLPEDLIDIILAFLSSTDLEKLTKSFP